MPKFVQMYNKIRGHTMITLFLTKKASHSQQKCCKCEVLSRYFAFESETYQQLLFGESELFELKCAELFELTYIELKVFGFHVFFQRRFVLPCFANHKDVRTCGTFKGVVSP